MLVHAPGLAVSFTPTLGVPEIVGVEPTTTGVGSEVGLDVGLVVGVGVDVGLVVGVGVDVGEPFVTVTVAPVDVIASTVTVTSPEE